MSEAVPEVEATYSLVAAVESLEWTVASLVVVWAGVELVEPKVVDVGPDFALGPKNSWDADHALRGAGPMVAGTEPGQVLAAMDSKWLGVALEVELELLGSKVAEPGLEFVMEAMHQLKVAVEPELRPKGVEAELVLEPVTTLVVEPDAVVAEPMVAVAGILAEPAEPKEAVLGTFAGVVAPMVVAAESLFVMAVPMGLGVAAALVLEVDPTLVAFAADLVAHESVSRVAEPVVALEAGPRVAEFEGPKYLWGAEAVLGSEQVDVSPKVAVVGTDSEVVPGAALELGAKNW